MATSEVEEKDYNISQQELQPLPTPDVSHYVQDKKCDDIDTNTVSAEDIMNAFSDEIGASDGEIINNLSCCLSFLLHEKSPLWKTNKKTHSIQPSVDLENIKKINEETTKNNNTQLLVNDNNDGNNERLKFISRCSNWQSNYKIDLKELPHAQHAQTALETLPSYDGRNDRWPKLMEFWNSWRKYQDLEEDYKVEQLNWTQQDINAIRSNVDLLLDGSPSVFNEIDTNNLATISGRAVNNSNDQRLSSLSDIKDELDMNNWLKKYKLIGMEQESFNASDAFESLQEDIADVGAGLFGTIVGYELHKDEDLQLAIQMAHLPMRHWKWHHIVQWIEKIDHLKQFTGIFYEWRINGDELLMMTQLQIQLLIQCCHGYHQHKDIMYTSFDAQSINALTIEIWKCLITTTITFQYDLYWNRLNQIKDNEESEHFETAWKIYDLIMFLRPTYSQGPKALWKLNAFYFSKIDNILSILIINGKCKELFQQCYPRYIFDDKSQHAFQNIRLKSHTQSIFNNSMIGQSIIDEKEEEENEAKEEEKVDFFARERSATTPTLTDKIKRDNDCLDKFADKCFGENTQCGNICKGCNDFLHGFDRIYCNVIILLICCISICCLITWFWMSWRSRFEIDILIDWVSTSIADRAIQQMEYEFFLPQMVLSMAITGLKAGDIPLNVVDFNDGRYDRFWIQFQKYRATKGSIYAMYMIETDNNTMIGCYMSNVTNLDNGYPFISVYDGRNGTGFDCEYDYNTNKRDCNRNIIGPYTDYDPTNRSWYKTGIEAADGFIGWTSPYQFAEGPFGISLIQAIDIENDNGDITRVIFLCEFTIDTLKPIIAKIGSIDSSLTYIMTADGSVIGSNIGEYYLTTYDEGETDNEYIIDSAIKIREEGYTNKALYVNITEKIEINNTDYDKVIGKKNSAKKIDTFSDDYTVILFSFKTVYLIPSNDNTNEEYGTIVILYDNSYLDSIKQAEIFSMILYCISIIISTIFVCLMGKHLQNIQTETKEEDIKKQTTLHDNDPNIEISIIDNNQIFLVDGTCICDHRSILLCSFWYSMLVFMATFYIWYNAVNDTLNDTRDVFLNEEYMIIQDKTQDLITVAESIADIVEERFSRGNMENILFNDTFPKEMDIFLTSLMNTFKYPNGQYYTDYIFLGFPDGKFIGTKQDYNDSSLETLLLGVRDASIPPNCNERFSDNINNDICKEFDYIQYAINDTTFERIETKSFLPSSVTSYDPRCRPWYNQTLQYMFNGDIQSAFGGIDNFNDFYFPEITRSADLTSDCIDMREYYLSIWNVYVEDIENVTIETGIESDNVNSVYLNKVRKNASFSCKLELENKVEPFPDYDIIWSRYVFSSNRQTGLTASKPIIDESTGDLLAIMAVDFTLQGLSDGLNATNNDGIGENPWLSWIFLGDGFRTNNTNDTYLNISDSTEMIASSDGQVIRTLTKSLSGGDTKELVPWLATSHPNPIITIDSKMIVDFYPNQCGDDDDDALPINASTNGIFIDLPIDRPELLAGRLRSYPYGDNGVELNWILAKSIDIDNFKTEKEDDNKIIFFVMFCTLLAIWIIQGQIRIGNVKKENRDSAESKKEILQNEDEKHKTEKFENLRFEMEEIVEGSSSEIWGIFLNEYFEEESINGILTLEMAQDFMAKESNKHIESEEDDDLLMLLCSLQLQRKWNAFRILSFIESSRYNSFISFILFLHLLCSIQIPETPNALKINKWSDPYSAITLILIYILIIIEVIDLILQTIKRYIQFGVVTKENLIRLTKLKFGFKHRYCNQVKQHSILWLILFGTKYYNIYLLQILLTLLIIINTLLMTISYIGPFEYWIPIVPILLAIRSHEIRKFSVQLFYAVYLAKDVLVSYMFLVTIVAIFGESIFQDILNPNQSTDTFSSTIRAWITSFVFVSTGENYNEIVYSALGVENIIDGNEQSDALYKSTSTQTWVGGNLLFFVIIAVIGLYFFIPIIIHKFETAFDHSRDSQHNKQEKTRINSIIAAFIMLDMNDDGSISVDEFQHLVHSSIISRDVLFEAFNASNDENDNDKEISLYEFIITLNNRRSLESAINGEQCINNKWQCYLECNWFRLRLNRFYTLVYIIIPSVCISLIRGLGGIDESFPSIMITIFFILNFIDINLRCYAFGRKRYAFLNKYENPPLIEQAITNWRIEKGIFDIDEITGEINTLSHFVKLTHIDKEWVKDKLHNTRPMSHWQKKTMSLVHRFELYTIWFGLIGFIITYIADDYAKGYRFVCLQIYLLRLFTLIESNQKLIVLIFTIVPHFLNLLAFAGIFIFIWARFGCTLFNGKKEFVLSEIYETGSNASFDTLGTSLLTLMQLMVGEGWHEIMYLNMIATRVEYSLYFIIYIIFVTLIISNIFVGLFLSEIEELDNEQSNDVIIKQFQDKHHNFNQIAIQRKKLLLNKLHNLENATKDTKKQIERINHLLQKNKVIKKKDDDNDDQNINKFDV